MGRDDFEHRMQLRRRAARRRDIALVIALLALVSSFAAFFFSQNTSVQRSYLYPYPYRDIVETYAWEYQVDSSLVAAVCLSESKFKNDVHSHRGAIGLMQLMPDTAAWIARRIGDSDYTPDGMHDPERNIRYGTWYLRSLQDEFAGNRILVLAAYNAGRGNVQTWIDENGWDVETFQDIGAIPYSETRHYVQRVLKSEEKYRELYP